MTSPTPEQPQPKNTIPENIQNQFEDTFSGIEASRVDKTRLFQVLGDSENSIHTLRTYYRYFVAPPNGDVREEYRAQTPQAAIFRNKADGMFDENGLKELNLYNEGGHKSLEVHFDIGGTTLGEIRVWRTTENGYLYTTYSDGKLTGAHFEPNLPHNIGQDPVPDVRNGIDFYKAEKAKDYDLGATYGKLAAAEHAYINTKRDGPVVRSQRVVNNQVVDEFVLKEEVDFDEVMSDLVPRDLKEDPFNTSCNFDMNWTDLEKVLEVLGIEWTHKGDEKSERTAMMKAYWEQLMSKIDSHPEET